MTDNQTKPAAKYGNRNVPKMIRQVDDLRQAIAAEGTERVQAAWDAVEEHIDYAYRALPADADMAQAALVERFAHECEQNAAYYLGSGDPRKRAAFLQAAKEARALAPDAGVKALAALRSERDAGWVEAAYQERARKALEADRDRLAAKLAEAEAQVAGLRGALIWCSGSADFQDGGVAREGWLKLCAPLIQPAALAAAGETKP